MPAVSVIIPTHNRPELLHRAIESVLAQTITDFEIIVVDDGDLETGAGLVTRSFKDSRIRYIAQKKPHSGAPAARNRGAAEALSEYVAFLDDDDEWSPEKLSLQTAALRNHPEAVATFTGVALYDETGERIGERWPRENGFVNVFERTLLHPYIWTSALMVRKIAFDATGGFDESLPKNQEWDLTLRLSKDAPFIAIDQLLTQVHVQGDDAHLGGRTNLPNIIRGHEMLLAKHRAEYAAHPKALGRVAFILFGLYREERDVDGMRRAACMAYKAQPWNHIYARHALAVWLAPRLYLFLSKISHHE